MSSQVVVITEARFAPSVGHDDYVSLDGVNGDDHWARYKFDSPSLRVAGRLYPEATSGALLGRQKLLPLPGYSGAYGLAKSIGLLLQDLWAVVGDADVLILRVPGALSTLTAVIAQLRGRRYVVEVVGDAREVLHSGALGAVGRVLGELAGMATQSVVRGAAGARYVTTQSLQSAYPARPGVPCYAFSDVRLDERLFAGGARQQPHEPYRLIAVGSQEMSYKGHDVAIRAMALARERGFQGTLSLVGQGRAQPALRELVTELGLNRVVHFLGQLEQRDVFELLLQSDALLHPSRTEGLPRVILEAQATGLPVVASQVGGIAEIVPADSLLPPGDPDALAQAIAKLFSSAETYRARSREGLSIAASFGRQHNSMAYAEWCRFIESLCIPNSRSRGRHRDAER